MNNYPIEREMRERTKESKERDNTTTTTTRAPRDVDIEDFSDPLGNNPEKVPKYWNNQMRDWFSFIKDYCRRKNLLDKYSIAIIKEWIEYADEVDYSFQQGEPITKKNFIRSLRLYYARANSVAWKNENEKCAANRLAAKAEREATHKTPSQLADEKRRENAASAKFTNDDWQLCFEECRNCIEKNGVRLCAAGCAIPANKRPRPMPPRECAQYAAKAQNDE